MKKKAYAPTRAVLYIRVSTENQAEHGHSLEAQQERLNAYAYALGLKVVDTCIDAGVSAATLDRPGLQRALGALVHGRADAILVTRLDRLTRSVRDFASLVETFFMDRCRLMSVNESIDTGTPTGRLILNVLMSVSQWEREAAAERTQAVMTRMKQNGSYTGGFPPFGWSVDEEGALVPNPIEAGLVAQARELRKAGHSLRAISDALGNNPRTRKRFDAKQIGRMCAAEAG